MGDIVNVIVFHFNESDMVLTDKELRQMGEYLADGAYHVYRVDEDDIDVNVRDHNLRFEAVVGMMNSKLEEEDEDPTQNSLYDILMEGNK